MHGAVDLGDELGLPNATSKAKHAVHCHISDGGGPLRVTPTPPFGLLIIAVWYLQMCWCHDLPPTEERKRGANTWALVDLLWVVTSRSAPGTARRAAASQGFPPPPRPPLPGRAPREGLRPLERWEAGSSANQKFSLAPSAKVSLGPKIPSAPPTTRGLLGGGGRPPPTAPPDHPPWS